MRVLAASVLLLAQEGEHSGPLGIPLFVWQLANLIGFVAVLLYFVARPLTKLFRQRQLEVERRLQEARERRAEAARLESEIHERMARLDVEIEEIRARGIAEGEAARAELIERAERDAALVARAAEEQIARRLEAAKEELRVLAAGLTTKSAAELLSAEINDEDRSRLLEDSVSRLRSDAR